MQNLCLLLVPLLLLTAVAAEQCGEADEKYAPSIEISGGHINGLARGIIGGNEAVEHSYPWMAQLYWPIPSGGGHTCGGSLISAQWIVTAAHCFIDLNTMQPFETDYQTLRTWLGAHVFFQGTEVKTESVVVHPDYKGIATGNDIALVKLRSPVQFTDTIKPICLPSGDDDYHADSGNVVTIGWGQTSGTGQQSATLPLKQTVLGLDWTKCKEHYTTFVHDNVICAFGTSTGTCNGDSGGPLMSYKDDHFVLAGITSFVQLGCANEPDVFTHVPTHRQWIKDTAGV